MMIPILWCLLCQGLLDRRTVTHDPEVPFLVKVVFYDESDLTAMALRGLNSQMGRLPGRPDEPPWWRTGLKFLEALSAPQAPYQDRFYLEYPTSTLVLFRLGFPQVDRERVPSTVADGQQFFIAHHHPRDEAEEYVWGLLNGAVRTYLLLMTVGLLGLIMILSRGYGTPDTPGGPLWLLVLPGAVYFSLNRFDIWPALATAAAFACLGRRFLFWGGVFLAIGVLLKVYPVVLLPVVLRYLGVRGGFRCLIGFTLTLLTGVGLSWLLLDWEATISPIRVQLNRAVEEESWIYYGRMLPLSLAYWKTGRTGLLLLTILAMVLTRPQSLGAVLRRCTVILIVFNSLSVFWSPQWLIWFLPLLVPLARQYRWALVAVVAQDLINYVSFPLLFWGGFTYWDFSLATHLAQVCIWIRGFITLAILGALAWEFWQTTAWRRAKLQERFQSEAVQWDAALRSLIEADQSPRGLQLIGLSRTGETVFTQSAEQELIALQPMMVQWEPLPGSDLEDVPQAREPRLVTAMFRYHRGGWKPVRIVMNLNPAQVLEKSNGQLMAVSPYPK